MLFQKSLSPLVIHLLRESQSHLGGGGQKPQPGRPEASRASPPAGARTEATARVPSIPARGHRVAGPEEHSRDRAASPGGNRSRRGPASAGSGPSQAPQGRGEGSGAPGRERRLGRRRGKESKLHLEADGGREGRARRSQGRPLFRLRGGAPQGPPASRATRSGLPGSPSGAAPLAALGALPDAGPGPPPPAPSPADGSGPGRAQGEGEEGTREGEMARAAPRSPPPRSPPVVATCPTAAAAAAARPPPPASRLVGSGRGRA